MLIQGPPLEMSLRGYFSKEYQPKSISNSNESSENPSQDLAKNGMFSFKVFLLFQVRVAGEKVAEKKKYFSKKKGSYNSWF